MRKATLSAVVLIATLFAAVSAHATTLYWSGGAVNVGGAGTWNTTAAHFGTSTSGPFTTVWANANTDDAIFTASGPAPGGAVVVGAAITMRGTFQWEQTPGTFPNYTFNGSSIVTFQPGSTLNAVGAIAGSFNSPYAGTITKSGTAQCTFNNANGNVTKFIINQGTADFASFNRFGSGADVADFLTFNGGVLRMNTTTAWTQGKSITVNSANGTITSSSATITLTQDKPITFNSGKLTVSVAPLVLSSTTSSGTGTLALSTATSCSAAGVIPAGVLVTESATFTMNNNSQTIKSFSGAGAISLGSGTLTINNPASETASGLISGSGGLTKNGTGTWTISNAGNSFTGTTTVNAGILKLGSATAAATSRVIVAAGARLDANSLSPTVAALSGAGTVINNVSGTITVNGTANAPAGQIFNAYSCFSGVITNGSLVKDGTHAMALRGSNTFDGTLTFSGGILSVGAATNRLPDSIALSVPGGALFQLDANGQTLSSLSGGGQVNLGGGTLTVNGTGGSTFSGVIENSELAGSSTALGHGLRGYYYTNIDFAGLGTVRDDATVNLADMSALPGYSPSAKTNQISIRWLGQVLTTVAGSYVFTTKCDDGQRLWVNGTLLVDDWNLHGPTAKSGTNTLAANTRYDIVMEFFNNTAGGAAQLFWTPPGDTASAIIPTDYLFLPGPGALTKIGSDTLTLTTPNTYGGLTTVGLGTLDAQADGALGNGNVVVADGGAGAALTLQLGATNGYISSSADLLLNGAAPVVNLNFTGTNYIHALSYDGGTTYQPAGVYGPVGSGADFVSARFTSTQLGYLNVSGGPSTNVLATSASPAVYGASVTFTSTVTGGAVTPAGTVAFYEGGNFLGTATLDGSGVATLSVTRLSVPASAHSVTAVYGGDAAHAGSTSTPVSQVITVATLTPSVTVSNKVYDGTTNASIASISFGGILSADTNYVHLAGTAVAFFEDKNVGNNKPVDISGLALAGSLAGNYVLSTTALTTNANITARGLTVTNLAGVNRQYDGTTNATFTGTPGLSNVVSGETVTLGGTPVASFATKNIGTNKVVTINGYTLGGADGGNYALSPTPTVTANITAVPLTVQGVTANNKVYDGTTNATLSGTATNSSGVVAGDTVILGGTPVAFFLSKGAANAKPVTVIGYTNSGADSTNYTLSQPVGLTANITPVPTSIVLVSSANPSGLTSNVTFTATLTASPLTVDAPTLSMVFLTNGGLVVVAPVVSNSPGVATAAFSTALLPSGTNTIAAQYATDGNFAASSTSLLQVVNSGATCGATNKIVGFVQNLNGTFTLSFLGTPQAQYYVLAYTNAAAAPASWTVLADSTNTVTNVGGLWSYTTTNGLPQRFYRGVSVFPCP